MSSPKADGPRSEGGGVKPKSKSDTNDDLKTVPLVEVEKHLASSPKCLTQAEATSRLEQYGPNEIEAKKVNQFLKFLDYFWGPIPWMIEVAVILSAVLGHWPDFIIILILLLANASIGFWEEHQAGKAIDALKAELAIKARVLRDGQWVNPPARELVPGDVIRLRLGDIVPADARLLEGDPVEVDQSALTGESLPATCGPGDSVFSASIIRQGEIGALVYATGTNTYFGKTAELVQDSQTVSHFQRAVLSVIDWLVPSSVAVIWTLWLAPRVLVRVKEADVNDCPGSTVSAPVPSGETVPCPVTPRSTSTALEVVFVATLPYGSSSASDAVRTLPSEADSLHEIQTMFPTDPVHAIPGVTSWVIAARERPAIVDEALTVSGDEPLWVPGVSVAVSVVDSSSKRLTLDALLPAANPPAKVTGDDPVEHAFELGYSGWVPCGALSGPENVTHFAPAKEV